MTTRHHGQGNGLCGFGKCKKSPEKRLDLITPPAATENFIIPAERIIIDVCAEHIETMKSFCTVLSIEDMSHD